MIKSTNHHPTMHIWLDPEVGWCWLNFGTLNQNHWDAAFLWTYRMNVEWNKPQPPCIVAAFNEIQRMIGSPVL